MESGVIKYIEVAVCPTGWEGGRQRRLGKKVIDYMSRRGVRGVDFGPQPRRLRGENTWDIRGFGKWASPLYPWEKEGSLTSNKVTK